MGEHTLRVLESIGDIDALTWDTCANSDGVFNPFLSHTFLQCLEESGSATSRTGWQPFHAVLEGKLEELYAGEPGVLGVVPMYVKSHSQGEYVFDHSWADAWHRAGGNYYPKLQASIPFTPASGRRVLPVRNDPELERTLFGACAQASKNFEVSSLHMTFMTESHWKIAGEMGYLQRMDQQYHWHNDGYATFDEFLTALASKKRKNLRRERREALVNDIEVEWLTGDDLTEAHWDAFYRFYMDTGSRKWGSPYLTRKFFSLISERFAEHTLLIMAKRNGSYIAGALNFIGSDALYGRNWGCTEYHPFLHFEICYYQAIDFAISRKLDRVEAGAQGQHKVARGYLPQATYSAHWIKDAGFRDAVARYLEDERGYVAQEIDYVAEHSPFKHSVEP